MLYAVAFGFHAHAGVDARLLLAILLPLFVVDWLHMTRDDVLAPLQMQPASRAVLYVGGFYLLVVYGVHAGREFIYFPF